MRAQPFKQENRGMSLLCTHATDISRSTSSGRFRKGAKTHRWSAKVSKVAAFSSRRRCNLISACSTCSFNASIWAITSDICPSTNFNFALVGAIDSRIVTLSWSVAGRLVLSSISRTAVARIENRHSLWDTDSSPTHRMTCLDPFYLTLGRV